LHEQSPTIHKKIGKKYGFLLQLYAFEVNIIKDRNEFFEKHYLSDEIKIQTANKKLFSMKGTKKRKSF
jgi:hypothetical protein